MKLQLRINGPGFSRLFPILPGVVTIGRKRRPTDLPDSPDATIVLDTPQVARYHATLDCTTTSVWITDLGSGFRTHVNGRVLQPWKKTELHPHDTVIIGLDFTLVLEDADEEVAGSTPRVRIVQSTYVPEPLPPERVYYDGEVPPGLARHSLRLLHYLPEVYQTNGNGYKPEEPLYDSAGNFMTRFLAIFESVLLPIEWTIVNFDMFLSAMTAPEDFLPWLEQWFLISTDASWSQVQRRTFLAEADTLFALRGTATALRRILEIYTGAEPEIIDDDPALPPHTFRITVHRSDEATRVDDLVVAQLIDMFKPAHTTYIYGPAPNVHA